MKRIPTILKDLGLTNSETSIYLCVLEFNEVTIADTAKHTGIPRSTCAEVLDALTNKNLISFFLKKKKRYFVAENPKRLVELFKQRIESLEEAVPRLEQLYKMGGQEKPEVRMYEGNVGLRAVLREVIAEQRNIDCIASIEDATYIIEGDLLDFIEQRKKHNLRLRLLTDRSKQSEEHKNRDAQELRETRFVPADYDFKTANFIAGEKVMILCLARDYPVGLVIQDHEIAETHRMYFELLWENAERQ